MSLHANDTVRSVVFGTNLWIFVNNSEIGTYTVPLTAGQPGFGGLGIPANSRFIDAINSPIARTVRVGHHDTVPPLAPLRTTFATSLLPYSASMKWQGVADDSAGIGVAGYVMSRNGTTMATISEPEFTDATVQAGTSYSYSVQALDFHGNASAATTINRLCAGI